MRREEAARTVSAQDSLDEHTPYSQRKVAVETAVPTASTPSRIRPGSGSFSLGQYWGYIVCTGGCRLRFAGFSINLCGAVILYAMLTIEFFQHLDPGKPYGCILYAPLDAPGDWYTQYEAWQFDKTGKVPPEMVFEIAGVLL